MPRLIFPFHFAVILAFAAGCQDNRSLAEGKANALLVLGLMEGAMADCVDQETAGKFSSQLERAECEARMARGVADGLEMAHAFGDLIALLAEHRRQLARQRDAGTLDAAGEHARQAAFGADFQRQMAVRDFLYNRNVRLVDFNYCEIEGDGLRCAHYDRAKADGELQKADAICDRRADEGQIETLQEYLRCVYQDGALPIRERYNYPHMDLARLHSRYLIDLSGGKLGQLEHEEEFKAKNAKFMEQYISEVKLRDDLRAAGDLNWRHRDCRIEGETLKCRPG